MSITGDRIHRGPDTAGDYAKKDYVDEQLALRVLKTGDTMTGDLKMAGGADSRAARVSTYGHYNKNR